MGMQKIKVGDQVRVIAGSDKGKQGTVSKLVSRKRRQGVQHCAIVDGVNRRKKHVKPNPQLGQEGGIVEQEAAIDLSNLAHVTGDGHASRVGIRTEEGKKTRYLKKDGKLIDSEKGK